MRDPGDLDRRLRPLLATLPVLLVAGAVLAADWPQLRGPARDGVSKETGLLKSWPAGGPKALWKAPVGDGYSAIAVAGGIAYTMYNEGGDELVAALDVATGKPVWRFRSDSAYRDGMGNGPRSTPVVDGNFVYALGAQGKLHALGAKTGRKVWSHDLQEELDGRSPQWGVAASPLVEGNLLLVDVGGSSNKSIAAFDKKTGKVVWTSQSDKAGYSQPIAVTVGGVRQVIFFTGTSIVALSPADGKLFWRHPWRTSYDVNASTPIFVAPDKIFVSSGYDVGAVLLKIQAGGGKASVSEVWRSRVMKNQFSSSVLHNGTLYGFDDATLKAIDAATGQERWKQRGFGHGSLIFADGSLYILSDRGKLVLAEATPAGYREKSSFEPLSGKCWTSPTLANGILYVRNEEQMAAFDVRAAAASPGTAKTGR